MENELLQKWERRQHEWRALGILVNGEKLAAEILSDLRSAIENGLSQTVTVSQAAKVSGYNADSIGRLIRQGRLRNYGTKRRPRLKLSELPRKARSGSAAVHDAGTNELIREAVAGRLGRGR